MDIYQAKQQIENTVTAYLTKDASGAYRIPMNRQRPIFLMGPPGIGKTAIMKQVAQEMGIALVSYSMTHHTRQSALGLPMIVSKTYEGVEYQISEYTMSEIIASVYEMIERTGIQRGILFLDEVNCVSETLAPSMLQFLQFKVFGRHHVPEGWIVVTAGNPPGYNKSVRDFDIVTWDRLKRIDVEPDYETWKKYALDQGVHGAILSYLEIKKNHFYQVITTVDGKSFVTARGWDDLSEIIYLYEHHDLKIDISLVIQYIQNKKIAKDFAIYYKLYNKYKSDYQVPKVLAGKADEQLINRAKESKFDERLALIGLLMEAITFEIKDSLLLDAATKKYLEILKQVRFSYRVNEDSLQGLLDEHIRNASDSYERRRYAMSMTNDEYRSGKMVLKYLEEIKEKTIMDKVEEVDTFHLLVKLDFEERVKELKSKTNSTRKKMEYMLTFAESAFVTDNEMLMLITEMTVSSHCNAFIRKFGCEKYFQYNKELLLHERQIEMVKELEVFGDQWVQQEDQSKKAVR